MDTATCRRPAWPTKAGAKAGIRPGCGVYRCPHGCGWHASTARHIPAGLSEDDVYVRPANVVDLAVVRDRQETDQ